MCRGLLAFFIFYFSTLFKYIPIYIFKLDTNIVNSDIKLSILLALFSALCVSFILIVMYWKDLKEEFKKFYNAQVEGMLQSLLSFDETNKEDIIQILQYGNQLQTSMKVA